MASLPGENGLFWQLVRCDKKIQIKVGAQLYTQFWSVGTYIHQSLQKDYTLKDNSRIRTARMPTASVSVAITRCQYQWGRPSSEQV